MAQPPTPIWQRTGCQAPSPTPVGPRETGLVQQPPRPHLGDGQWGAGSSPLRPRIKSRGQSSEESEPSSGGTWVLGGMAWA